jgi:hypothetical protein
MDKIMDAVDYIMEYAKDNGLHVNVVERVIPIYPQDKEYISVELGNYFETEALHDPLMRHVVQSLGIGIELRASD